MTTHDRFREYCNVHRVPEEEARRIMMWSDILARRSTPLAGPVLSWHQLQELMHTDEARSLNANVPYLMEALVGVRPLEAADVRQFVLQVRSYARGTIPGWAVERCLKVGRQYLAFIRKYSNPTTLSELVVDAHERIGFHEDFERLVAPEALAAEPC